MYVSVSNMMKRSREDRIYECEQAMSAGSLSPPDLSPGIIFPLSHLSESVLACITNERKKMKKHEEQCHIKREAQ
jgi:hypothetical protein